MERDWMDKRDGKRWTVEAIPMMQRMDSGKGVQMITEVQWRVWFRADDAAHDTLVDPNVGMELEQAPDAELQSLLDSARRR